MITTVHLTQIQQKNIHKHQCFFQALNSRRANHISDRGGIRTHDFRIDKSFSFDDQHRTGIVDVLHRSSRSVVVAGVGGRCDIRFKSFSRYFCQVDKKIYFYSHHRSIRDLGYSHPSFQPIRLFVCSLEIVIRTVEGASLVYRVHI